MESPGGNGGSSTAASPVAQIPIAGAALAAKSIELSASTPINALRTKLVEQLLYETRLTSNCSGKISRSSEVMKELGELEEMLDPIFEGLNDWAVRFTGVVAKRKALTG